MGDPKSSGKLGNLIALAIGTGLIAYFARLRSGAPTGLGPNESLLEIVLGGGAIILAICATTYVILKAWDSIMARLRRR